MKVTMNKLQRNFTTPEESKRLLALGIPEWTADLRRSRVGGNLHVHKGGRARQKGKFTHSTPCWSLGRLIELYNITTNLMPGMELDLNYEPENCTYIELVIASFEVAADCGLNDFSQLEDYE
jgi:hypothetical protein